MPRTGHHQHVMPRNGRIQRSNLVGKTISGVVARRGAGGRTVVMMLQFDDGSCLEFVTPQADRELKALASASQDADAAGSPVPQLALAV